MNLPLQPSRHLVTCTEIDYLPPLLAKLPTGTVPTGMSETVEDLVAGSALLRGASEAARAHLRRARLAVRSLEPGEHVFQAGDVADAIYFLLGARNGRDGLDVDPLVQVELHPQSGKRGLRFDRIVHGEIFGELELLESGLLPKNVKRTTSAIALTPATIVPLPLPLLSDLIGEDTVLRARLIRTGSQRLLSALTQQHDMGQNVPDLLLADWLVELAADIGIAEGNRVRFPNKIAQSDIAADLGVSRETMSRRLNEWERSGLLRTGARSQQIEIVDYQRISRLASLRSARSRAALDRTIDDIDAAISSGDLVRARNIGLDILRYYPSSPELHHRTALAAARSGDAKGALALLTRSGLPIDDDLSILEETVRKARNNPFMPMDRIVSEPYVDEGFSEDEPDSARVPAWEAQLVEDIAALNARVLKERAFTARTRDEKRKRAGIASDAYNRLYTAKQGFYPAVNAATMALCAGDGRKARKVAERLAISLPQDTKDYWPLATLAEALLIMGRGDEAQDVLLRARDAHDGDDGAKASTILQLRRLGAVLDVDIEAYVDALRPRNVAVISGHLFRADELDAEAQATTEHRIAKAAEALMSEHNVGFVYGALACGSDIILAEAALKIGAQFDAVLPFNTDRFVEMSVKIGDPPGQTGKWEQRLRAILDGSLGPCTLTVMDPQEPIARDLDGYFHHGFRYAAGCALQRAAMLQTACGLIAVCNGDGVDTLAGTERAVADWRAHDRPYNLIPFPHERGPRPDPVRGTDAFRPIVFLWEGAQGAKAPGAALERIFKKAGKGLERVDRTHRDGRRGCCIVAESTEHALDVAHTAADAARKAKQSIRIVCDFGLVLGRGLKPEKKLIARLQSADDLAGLPLGPVLTTEAFAAHAKFDLGGRIRLVPVGRAEVTPAADQDSPQLERSRPSLPIFAVETASTGARIR